MQRLALSAAPLFLATAAAWASPQDLPHRLADITPPATITQTLSHCAIDGEGGLFLGGQRDDPTINSYGRLARVTRDGTTLWSIDFGASIPATVPNDAFSTTVEALEPDGAGGVFAAGRVIGADFGGPGSNDADGYVGRFDSVGNLVWAVRLEGGGTEAVRGLCSDGVGGVFAVGWALGGSFGGGASPNTDAFVSRIDAAGNVVFRTRYTRPNEGASFWSVTPDGAGGVFCGGSVRELSPPYDTTLTARFDGTGALTWALDGNNIDFYGGEVSADGAGGFYYGGTAYVIASNDQGLIERRDGSGQVI